MKEKRRREARGAVTIRPMNKSMTIPGLAVLGTVCAVSSVEAQATFQKLTGAQIQAKFPGMELTDESHWGEILDRNGTLRIYSMRHKSLGKW
jgi:hypothetical protein